MANFSEHIALRRGRRLSLLFLPRLLETLGVFKDSGEALKSATESPHSHSLPSLKTLRPPNVFSLNFVLLRAFPESRLDDLEELEGALESLVEFAAPTQTDRTRRQARRTALDLTERLLEKQRLCKLHLQQSLDGESPEGADDAFEDMGAVKGRGEQGREEKFQNFSPLAHLRAVSSSLLRDVAFRGLFDLADGLESPVNSRASSAKALSNVRCAVLNSGEALAALKLLKAFLCTERAAKGEAVSVLSVSKCVNEPTKSLLAAASSSHRMSAVSVALWVLFFRVSDALCRLLSSASVHSSLFAARCEEALEEQAVKYPKPRDLEEQEKPLASAGQAGGQKGAASSEQEFREGGRDLSPSEGTPAAPSPSQPPKSDLAAKATSGRVEEETSLLDLLPFCVRRRLRLEALSCTGGLKLQVGGTRADCSPAPTLLRFFSNKIRPFQSATAFLHACMRSCRPRCFSA